MNKQKRIAAIHDISCFGKCSLTVALPVLSAAGFETCPVPTALLSTHTGGFEGYTFLDLTNEIMPVTNHWKSIGLEFDAIYSGYLGSYTQLEHTKEIIKMFKKDGSTILVDPVMGDRGRLYAGFDSGFAKGMASLCSYADIIVPNITEAAFMTDTEYLEEQNEEYIQELAHKTVALGAKNTVITGVSLKKGEVGAVVVDKEGKTEYIMHKKADGMYHGTGDVFASVLLCGVMHGMSVYDAVDFAAEFVIKSIEKTKNTYRNENYGVNFEECIPFLVKKLRLGD